MNVDTIKNNIDSIISSLNEVNSFSFELELPESKTFAELIQSNKQEESVQTSLPGIPEDNMQLVKTLQGLALKDKIPFRFKDINDIRLLIYAHDLMRYSNSFKIELDSLSDNDINFLKQCFENPNLAVNSINQQNGQLSLSLAGQAQEVSYKTFNISKGLANLIDYAYKSNKPVRLDFEGNSSVILRVSTEGKLSAEFLSSSIAMEYILKNSIPHLRNRLDSEGIPYKEIVYKERNGKQNKEEQERK